MIEKIRGSLEGICRIFDVSMPWLLQFRGEIIRDLPRNLKANLVESKDFEVAVVELDEQWSYVGNKKIGSGFGLFSIALHGKRSPCMLEKGIKILPNTKLFLGDNIAPWEKNQKRRIALSDLTKPSDKGGQDS